MPKGNAAAACSSLVNNDDIKVRENLCTAQDAQGQVHSMLLNYFFFIFFR
jgi:hypothetical protein